jgi:hypothetical protein
VRKGRDIERRVLAHQLEHRVLINRAKTVLLAGRLRFGETFVTAARQQTRRIHAIGKISV